MNNLKELGQRIVVAGATGSGKTTLAKHLSQLLAIPHIELDAFYVDSGPISMEVFRERIQEVAKGDAWVLEGGYLAARDIAWGRATLFIWLDYPLPIVLGQVLRRSLRAFLAREHLRNRDRHGLRLWESFVIPLVGASRAHRRHRREYPLLLSRPEYAHLHAVRLRSPKDTREWLSNYSG